MSELNDIVWESAYGSLGKLLEKIGAAPEVETSPELKEITRNAVLFFHELGKLVDPLIGELRSKNEVLDRLTSDADWHHCVKRSYSKYVNLAIDGNDPIQVSRQAIEDGLHKIHVVGALRSAFNMPLTSALDLYETEMAKVAQGEKTSVQPL